MGRIKEEPTNKNMKTNKKDERGDKKGSGKGKGHGNLVVVLDIREKSKLFWGIPPKRLLPILRWW